MLIELAKSIYPNSMLRKKACKIQLPMIKPKYHRRPILLWKKWSYNYIVPFMILDHYITALLKYQQIVPYMYAACPDL